MLKKCGTVMAIVLCFLMSMNVFAGSLKISKNGEAHSLAGTNIEATYKHEVSSREISSTSNDFFAVASICKAYGKDYFLRYDWTEKASSVQTKGVFRNGISLYSYTVAGETPYALIAETDGTKDLTYTGKRLKPSLTVSIVNMDDRTQTVLPRSCYNISYGTNTIGASWAKITLKSTAKKKYGVNGLVSLNFFRVPRKASSVTVASKSKGKATVKFTSNGVSKKSTGMTNLVEYSTDKNFKKNVKYKTTTSNSVTVSGLKSNKTYYFRVAPVLKPSVSVGMSIRADSSEMSTIEKKALGVALGDLSKAVELWNSYLVGESESVAKIPQFNSVNGALSNEEVTNKNFSGKSVSVGLGYIIKEADYVASSYKGKVLNTFSDRVSVKIK